MPSPRIEPGHYAATERDYHRQLAGWWRRAANTQPPGETSTLAEREATYHERQGAHWELIRRFCIRHERRRTDGPERHA
jgi:hypothetical protein